MVYYCFNHIGIIMYYILESAEQAPLPQQFGSADLACGPKIEEFGKTKPRSYHWLEISRWFDMVSGWWFGTCFPYIGTNHPNWLIFFKMVKTTNQILLSSYIWHCFPVDFHIPQKPTIMIYHDHDPISYFIVPYNATRCQSGLSRLSRL